MRNPLTSAGIRARRRRGASGFTLVELMVVVILISLLAVMALPSMQTARDDRMCFDYARQFQAMIHRGEVRAMARGAAQLVVIDRSGTTKGRITLFEAIDATPAAQGGPKPVSSCKGQRDATGAWIDNWAQASAWVPGGTLPTLSPIIETVNLDGPGVEAGMNLFATLNEVTAGTVQSIVICYTPGGNTYVGTGATPGDAVTAMRAATIYNGYFTVDIARHDTANLVNGLTRRIIVAGGAAPRLVSQ